MSSRDNQEKRGSRRYYQDDASDAAQDDPYNRASVNSAQTHQLYLEDDIIKQQQIAYDSMSTILEVDSEESEMSLSESLGKDQAKRVDSPLEVRTTRTPEDQDRKSNLLLDTPKQRDSGIGHSETQTISGRVSPVVDLPATSSSSADDRFSGALNALVAQVERLRRRDQSGRSNFQVSPIDRHGDSSSRSTPSSFGQFVSEVTDKINASSSPNSDSTSTSGQHEVEGREFDSSARTSRVQTPTNTRIDIPPVERETSPASNVSSQQTPDVRSATHRQPNLRSTSTDSLMMITLSPLSSPRVKFPLVNVIDPDERRVVEVSNKSTLTAIDNKMMDQMVKKFFVDTRDVASQSIEFDCDDYQGNSSYWRSKRNSINNQQHQVSTKSIAVGTEKFSRERFSLLPPTKTRSTQTKSNMDNDIGVSETRRFKLGHTEFGPVIRGKPANIEMAEESPVKLSQSEPSKGFIGTHNGDAANSAHSESDTSLSKQTDLVTHRNGPQESKSQPLAAKSAQVSDTQIESRPDNETANSADTSNSIEKANESMRGIEHKQEEPKEKTSSESDLEPEVDTNKVDARNKELISVSDKNNKATQAIIPIVKTELRVIIEIQDSKSRHTSELTSDSQLVDGKLSKKTQVSTSKQVVVSPRQAFNKLESAGKQHSLMLQPANRQLTHVDQPSSSPIAMAAANQQILRSSISSPNAINRRQWREVAKSSICNDIETNINQPVKGKSSKGKSSPNHLRDIVISSNATINNFANDTSAIDLKSKAIKRYERLREDRKTGKLTSSGELSEKILVESEAAFDENHFNQQEEKLAEPTIDNRESEEKFASQPLVSHQDPNSSLIKRVEEQESRARAKSSQDHSPSPILQKPTIDRWTAFDSKPRLKSAISTPNMTQTLKSPTTRIKSPLHRRNELEIEEETEDRRQVSENGRLVYDDHLRERRYESHKSPTRDKKANTNTKTETSHILRNSASRSQLLKPILLQASDKQTNRMASPVTVSPPILFADQTSDLSANSSDPETLDSGFAHSAMGSTNRVNQNHKNMNQNSNLNQDTSRDPRKAQRKRLVRQEALLGDDSDSLTFVDDEVDELIEQLDESRMRHPTPNQLVRRSTPEMSKEDARDKSQVMTQWPGKTREPKRSLSGLISPPAAFCASEPALNRAADRAARVEPSRAHEGVTVHREPQNRDRLSAGTRGANDTELTTRLTRSKAKPVSEGRELESRWSGKQRTRTQFEQNLLAASGLASRQPSVVGPAPSDSATNRAASQTQASSRFRAQVTFESDTDSVADRNSLSSGQSSSSRAKQELQQRAKATNRKELVSETKYTLRESARQDRNSESNQESGESPKKGTHVSLASRAATNAMNPNTIDAFGPNWDYSLRVKRMRENQVDSRVNTYIKHSRQPLINTEAS